MLRKNSGFSLIELMVAIAIVVVLTAIAVPNFISWLPRYRLATAMDELFVLMQQARLRAIRENANVVVNFDGNSSFLAFVDSGVTGDAGAPFDTALRGNGTQDGIEPNVGGLTLPTGIEAMDISFSGDQTVVFTSRGMTNSDFGHVYLTDGRGHYKGIVVTRSGSIRTSGSRDGSTWD